MFLVYVIVDDLVALRMVLALELELVQLPHDVLVRLMKSLRPAPSRALLDLQRIHTFLAV